MLECIPRKYRTDRTYRTFRANPWGSGGFLKPAWACVPCLLAIDWRTHCGTDRAAPYRALFCGYQQTTVLLKITLRMNNSGIQPMHRISQPGSTQACQARGAQGRTEWVAASTLPHLLRQRWRVSACRGLLRLADFRPGAADAPGMQPAQGAMVLGLQPGSLRWVMCAGSCPHGTIASLSAAAVCAPKNSLILVSAPGK